ncbi:response regulator transcription factor [Roseomonas sp. F4]
MADHATPASLLPSGLPPKLPAELPSGRAAGNKRPVLVLEDDAAVAEAICAALLRDGWETVLATTLAEARLRLLQDRPRLVIADLGLPDGNGIAFVREAATCADLGIIVVSGRSEEVDRVVGLEVGADDYLAKPFSLREMIARVRALNRRLDSQASRSLPAEPQAAAKPDRNSTVEPGSWMVAGLVLQPARQRMLAADGTETRLTGAEAGMLRLLLTEPEHLAGREAISEQILGRKLLPQQRSVDQLASNLRQKMLAASSGLVTIAAQRGRGYRLIW